MWEGFGITIFKTKTSQELISLLHKLVVKPLLKIDTKQIFTIFHKLKIWWVSLTIIIQIIIHIIHI